MIRTEHRIWLCRILIILNLAVIWGNSLLCGAESGQMSGGIVAFVMELLGIPDSASDFVHLLIRKLAHLTEFACLSALMCWHFGMVKEKMSYQCLLPVLLAMVAALTDETIQLYTPDRGPSLVDVWIDTLGATLGMSAVQLVRHLKKKESKHLFGGNIT